MLDHQSSPLPQLQVSQESFPEISQKSTHEEKTGTIPGSAIATAVRLSHTGGFHLSCTLVKPDSHLAWFFAKNTGGSCLSRTAVKPNSRLARIFCIISFLYNLINLMQISTDKPDN